MYEIQCFDSNGNTINNFTQWDVDQKIIIPLKGVSEDYLSIAPEIHYANFKSKEALVVRSTVSNNDTITASVPNILLQDPYPLLVYVYLTNSTDVSSQKTILHNEIPIRKRVRPSDYQYVENIKRITAEMIKDEIEASTESTRTNAIRDITNTKNSATSTVTNKKNEFIATGDQIIEDANAIKADTQATYDNTVTVANQTQEKIENDMNVLMLQNGLAIKSIDDGEGNVTSSIIILQE